MDWEAIGAIGETLAAIGVLISLVYLAIQIRQNNNWLRQQAFQLSTNEIRRWTGRFAESESASELWLKGLRDFNGLNQTETFRFSMMVFGQLSVHATYHEHDTKEFLGLRRGLEIQVASWTKRGWFAMWWESNKWMMPPPFAAVVDQIVIANLPNEDKA